MSDCTAAIAINPKLAKAYLRRAMAYAQASWWSSSTPLAESSSNLLEGVVYLLPIRHAQFYCGSGIFENIVSVLSYPGSVSGDPLDVMKNEWMIFIPGIKRTISGPPKRKI